MVIENKSDPERTKEQGHGEVGIRRITRVDHVKWASTISFKRQPQGREPAIRELEKVSHYAVIRFDQKWVPVDIDSL